MAGNYESEITTFLRELKDKDPAIEPGQQRRPGDLVGQDVDPDLYRRFRESRVPQPAYVYQPKVK